VHVLPLEAKSSEGAYFAIKSKKSRRCVWKQEVQKVHTLPLEAKSSEGAYFAFGSMKFRKCMFRL
jgi:hypothetical protein